MLDQHLEPRRNWTPTRVPTNGDDLIFPDDAFVGREARNDLTNLTVNSIRFAGRAGIPFRDDYLVTGNRFRLQEGIEVDNDPAGLEPTISAPIELVGAAAKTINVRNDDARLTLSGTVSGTGGLTQQGAGQLRLSGTNSYTGRTTVNVGQLRVLSAGALGADGAANNTVVADGALLRVDTSRSAVIREALAISGRVSDSVGALHSDAGTWAGTITLATADATISVPSGESFTISGQITGPGGLTKFSRGTLRLSGTAANNYAGSTFVSAGTLELDKDGAVAVPGRLNIGNTDGSNNADTVRLLRSAQIASTATVNIRRTGVLQLETQSQRVGNLVMTGGEVRATGTGAGRGVLVLNGPAAATAVTATTDNRGDFALIDSRIDLNGLARVFVVNPGTNPFGIDLRIAGGVLGGAGGLTKQGTGGLQLSGIAGSSGSSYTGTTQVTAGRLEVEVDYSSTPVLVTGGVLRGCGTVGPLMANGGEINPGCRGQAGSLRVRDRLTLNRNSTFRSFVSHPAGGNLTFNQLQVIGDGVVTLNDPILAVIAPVGSRAADSGPFLETVNPFGTSSGFVHVGDQRIDGTTDGTVERRAFQFTPDQVRLLEISYAGGDGNDVTLTDRTAAARDLVVSPDITDEGQEVTLSGSLFGSHSDSPLYLLVNWGDGSPAETFHPGTRPFDLWHVYRDNPAGQPDDRYTITATWFDQHGAGNRRQLDVTVRNVAPRVDAGADATIRGGAVFARGGSFTDPGADAWTATVDYGDGAGTRPLGLNPAGRFTLRHRYDQPGTYTVTVSVRDDDAGVGLHRLQVTVLPGGSGSAGPGQGGAGGKGLLGAAAPWEEPDRSGAYRTDLAFLAVQIEELLPAWRRRDRGGR